MDQLNSTTFTLDRQRGQHLKFEDRCSIRIFNKLGYSLRKTAETIGCSASTSAGVQESAMAQKDVILSILLNADSKITKSIVHVAINLISLIQTQNSSNGLLSRSRLANGHLMPAQVIARKHELFAADKIPCTKTLYTELWAGNLPLTPFDVPEALRRTTKHIKLVRISAFLDPVQMNALRLLRSESNAATGKQIPLQDSWKPEALYAPLFTFLYFCLLLLGLSGILSFLL